MTIALIIGCVVFGALGFVLGWRRRGRGPACGKTFDDAMLVTCARRYGHKGRCAGVWI